MPRNLLRVVGDPLDDRNVKLVVTELEQTAVAASVVGTSTRRLKELGALADAIADALTGERAEVKKLRTRLRQLSQNAKISGTRNYQAPRAMRALAAGVVQVQALLKKGIGKAPLDFAAGGFTAKNGWGYTEAEARSALRALEKASRALTGVGLGTAVADVDLWPGTAVQYLRDLSSIAIDPDKNVTSEDILAALGQRLWDSEFRDADFETWGGKTSPGRFAAAFAEAVSGKKLDPETAARLQTTVGKLAAKWPEVA